MNKNLRWKGHGGRRRKAKLTCRLSFLRMKNLSKDQMERRKTMLWKNSAMKFLKKRSRKSSTRGEGRRTRDLHRRPLTLHCGTHSDNGLPRQGRDRRLPKAADLLRIRHAELKSLSLRTKLLGKYLRKSMADSGQHRDLPRNFIIDLPMSNASGVSTPFLPRMWQLMVRWLLSGSRRTLLVPSQCCRVKCMSPKCRNRSKTKISMIQRNLNPSPTSENALEVGSRARARIGIFSRPKKVVEAGERVYTGSGALNRALNISAATVLTHLSRRNPAHITILCEAYRFEHTKEIISELNWFECWTFLTWDTDWQSSNWIMHAATFGFLGQNGSWDVTRPASKNRRASNAERDPSQRLWRQRKIQSWNQPERCRCSEQ